MDGPYQPRENREERQCFWTNQNQPNKTCCCIYCLHRHCRQCHHSFCRWLLAMCIFFFVFILHLPWWALCERHWRVSHCDESLRQNAYAGVRVKRHRPSNRRHLVYEGVDFCHHGQWFHTIDSCLRRVNIP